MLTVTEDDDKDKDIDRDRNIEKSKPNADDKIFMWFTTALWSDVS